MFNEKFILSYHLEKIDLIYAAFKVIIFDQADLSRALLHRANLREI
jgi:uncharacterized protein YjbI with pentapeptide repeats